jgi:hypothetical protein
MASIIYETPMMVWHRIGNSSGKPCPPDAFKQWVLQSQKNPAYARTYYLSRRMGYTQDDEAYENVKKMIAFEKDLGNDSTNIPFKILKTVFGDLW